MAFDLDQFILDWFSPLGTEPKNPWFFSGNEPELYFRSDDEQDALEWLYIANVFERARLAGSRSTTVTLPVQALRTIFVSARRGGLPTAPELEPERLIEDWDQLSLGFKIIVADYAKKGLHKNKGSNGIRKPMHKKMRLDHIVGFAIERKAELENEGKSSIQAEELAIAEARMFARKYGLNMGETYIQKLMGRKTADFNREHFVKTPGLRPRASSSDETISPTFGLNNCL